MRKVVRLALLVVLVLNFVFAVGIVNSLTNKGQDIKNCFQKNVKKPRNESLNLPRSGITVPQAITYEIRGNFLIQVGRLESDYLSCKVRKKVKDEYLLVKISDDRYSSKDYYIVHENEVIMLYRLN